MKNLLFIIITSISLVSFSQQCKIYTSTSKDFIAHQNSTGCTYEIRRAFEEDGAFNTDLEVFYTVSGTGANEVDLVSGSAIIPSGKSYVEISINPINNPNSISEDRDLTLTVTENSNYTITNDFGHNKGEVTIKIKDELPLKAFPTAYGAGAYAKGGRGGSVYHVTRLDDYAVGSTPIIGTFRWAIAQARPATIVFDVSGTIILKRSLIEDFNDLTIAGQTAPTQGITLTTDGSLAPNNDYLKFEAKFSDDLIMRYFKVRHQITNNGGFLIYSGTKSARNIILDHCSFSWAGNASFGIRGTLSQNVTLQNTILAESKVGSLLSDSQQHEFSNNFSCHSNIWYNISHRVPNNGLNGRTDNINNFIHNWRFRLSYINGDNRYNHVNNYHSTGSITELVNIFGAARVINQLNTTSSAYPNPITGGPDQWESTPYDYEIYSNGNIIDKGLHGIEDDNKLLFGEFDLGNQNHLAPDYVFTNTQHSLLGAPLPVKTAEEINIEVRTNPNAGANASLNADGSFTKNWDNIDDEYLAILAQGEGVYENYNTSGDENERSYYSEPRYLNFAANLTIEPLNTRPDNFYNPEKSLHIPEVFYDLYMSPGDSHNDIAPSGYTWMEEYLNGVDAPIVEVPVESVEIVAPEEFNGLQFTESVDLDVNFNPSNATIQNGFWTSSNPEYATVNANGVVSAVGAGITTITFTSSENNLISDTLEIEVFFSAFAGEDRHICDGDNTTEIVLTATNGESHLWSTGETTQSIVVHPLSTTTYTVTITYGDEEQSDDITIFIDPSPNVVIANGDSVDIMDGDFVTLSASGANTYQWDNGATQPNIAVSPSQSTTYEVRGYIADCYEDKQVSVNVIPEVVADAGDNVEICLGESISLTASGGDEYEWSTGESTPTIEVSPTVTTEYTVTVFNALDFDEDSVIVFVDDVCEEEDDNEDEELPLIPEEPEDFGFDIFPNPATHQVNIRLSGSTALTWIYLYDITGKMIYAKRIANDTLSQSSITQFNVGSLHPGMYYIKLKSVTRDMSKKLIVQ